jgi:hypothetical protein
LDSKKKSKAISTSRMTETASKNGTGDWGVLLRDKYHGKITRGSSIEPTDQRNGRGTRCRNASKSTQIPARV